MSNKLAKGIDNHKKAELDALTKEILDAQYDVNEVQAIVNSLSIKSSQFTQFLSEALAAQNTTLSNLHLCQQAVDSIKGVVKGSKLAAKTSEKACSTANAVSQDMAQMLNKLMFSIDIIDKVAQQAAKQKNSNPLVPDQLITYLNKATSDANKAFASALTALNSCYAADATLQEAQGITSLEHQQAHQLKERMESPEPSIPNSPTAPSELPGILTLLNARYQKTQEKYQTALANNNAVTHELSHAQKLLATATSRLASLKSGLAAASAAAYAA